MKANLSFKLAGFLALSFLAETSFGLGGEILPSSSLPDQVSKNLTEERHEASPQMLPSVVTPEKQAPSALAEQAKKVKFQLNGIILEGNKTYSTAVLAPIYSKDLHKTITVEELFNIVQQITNHYRNNGYILSRAILPPQHVKGGIVRIQVIEGYIADVDVTGNPHGATCITQAFGHQITLQRPLELSRMEKYLLLANEVPGTQVKAVLQPSKKYTGAADLTLVTENKPVFGYVSYDNYGTRYIGPQQMTASFGLNSFAVSGDSGVATMIKTPKGGELTYTDINYSMPLDDEGTRWQIGGTRAHTHPLYVLAIVQVDGLNDNYYTTFSFPWRRTKAESLTFRVGANYLDSTVTILDTHLYTDHVRSVDIGGTYNFADQWWGSNLFSADFRQGLPILGYTSNTNPDTAETSRPGGRGDYTKIIATVGRLQSIYGNFSVYGTASGQWAFNPVLASEQFSFGGSQLGRGYDVAEIIGDKGLAGSLELRYDWGIGRFLLNSLQLYAFYDAGRVWNFKDLGGIPKVASATSAGFGTRFYFTKYVSGNFMWAQPLTRQVAAEEIIGDGKRPRVFFSFVASF